MAGAVLIDDRMASRQTGTSNGRVDTLDALIARIKSTPPDPGNRRPATGSLVDWLQSAPDDPDFDLAAWQRDWESVEKELNALDAPNAAFSKLDS